jgi:hypothetical protein
LNISSLKSHLDLNLRLRSTRKIFQKPVGF